MIFSPLFQPLKRARMFTFLTVVAIIIGGCVWASQRSFGNDTASTPVPAATALTVTSATVETKTWPTVITASGPVEAWQEASIGTEINGPRLTELLVNVGYHVTKGQVLARYSTETLQVERTQLHAAYMQAEADRQRAEKLKAGDAISQQQYIQYITAAQIAKAQLDAKDIQLSHAEITAPDDGTISARSATLGSIASSGQELFRLICQDRLEWRGQLTAQQLTNVRPGQKVSLALTNGDKAEGLVRQISPALDPKTRMATVYVDVTLSPHIRSGMFAEGHINLDSKDILAVPAESVVIRDGHTYVFVLQDTQQTTKVNMQEVTVGQRQDGLNEIVSGLEAGAHVAVQGAGFLNDGDAVLVNNTAPAPDKGQD